METTSVISTINLNKVCRICLIEMEEMHSIFSELHQDTNADDETTFIYEILLNISAIRVLTEDGLPTLICTNCLELAHTSYKFQQQCNRSQAILDTYMSQIELIKVEPNTLETFTESALLISKDKQNETENMQLLDSSSLLGETLANDLSNSLSCNGNLEIPLEVNLHNTHLENLNDEDDVCIKEEEINLALEKESKSTKQIERKKQTETINVKNKKPRSRFSHYLKVNENGEKIYACNLCNKTYKYGNNLQVHIRGHTEERPYVCTLCGKAFAQHASLTYHLRSHSGERPYSCEICGKKYRQSGSLTAHMRVHTGQRPFLCSVCGRGFRQAPDLKYHMRTHTKEKPYMCNICGKTMSMQCHLVQHMRSHTGERPFKCDECNKAFPSATRLRRHAIIHTGLKPYTCEVCEKSFNRVSSLKVHSKIHTDERPHVCHICGKGFIQAHALRGHILTHSSGVFLKETNS